MVNASFLGSPTLWLKLHRSYRRTRGVNTRVKEWLSFAGYLFLGIIAIPSMSRLVTLSLSLVEFLGTLNPYLRCDLDSSFSSTLPLDNRCDPF